MWQFSGHPKWRLRMTWTVEKERRGLGLRDEVCVVAADRESDERWRRTVKALMC